MCKKEGGISKFKDMTQLFQGQPSSVMKAKNEFNTLETARDDKGENSH